MRQKPSQQGRGRGYSNNGGRGGQYGYGRGQSNNDGHGKQYGYGRDQGQGQQVHASGRSIQRPTYTPSESDNSAQYSQRYPPNPKKNDLPTAISVGHVATTFRIGMIHQHAHAQNQGMSGQ